ncbi:MAG: hypothetical protein MJZ63_02980 [Muribaculaceae bacterium]|nr:hypothetical protein [Muribaculaceae bacterium]
MKRFIVLSFLLANVVAAFACGPFARPHFFVFSVYPTTQWQQVGKTEMVKYWEDYTGKKEIEWEVDALSDVNLKEFNKSENSIVQTALKKNDTETINYLKKLIQYLQISEKLAPNAWNYPSKEDVAKYQKELRDIRNSARIYKGEKYRPQYTLLEMRCNLALGQEALNKKLWVNTAYKLPASVYRDMMKGLYANALVKDGKRDDAIKIYGALGDMPSIKWLVRDKRNLKGIKSEYEANPNSATLIFLVQDFVNNAQETKDNKEDREVMQQVEATAIYNDEIKQFIEFAKQVVSEGKTQSPAMWQAAAGYLNSMLSNDKDALTMLTKAMQLDGTDRMKDNARVCRLAVKCKHVVPTNDYYDYLYDELKWLGQKAQEGHRQGDWHYSQMIDRFVFDNLNPGFMEKGNYGLATNLIAFAYNAYDLFHIDNEPFTAGSVFWDAIDELSADELMGYKKYMKGQQSTKLEKWLASDVDKCITDDDYNDMIGTKLMREGNFQAAIPYLEKVPLGLIAKQGISAYMARRDFNKERWMGHQAVESVNEEATEVKTNQKLDFCREVAKLENAPQTEENAYRLASLLYQASYKGDCWYLTRYNVSIYDTVRYRNEALLISQAIDLLKKPAASKNFRLKEKALYALAFIPQGEDLIYTDYVGKNYTPVLKVNKKTPQFAEMNNLLAFYNANPQKVSTFVSKCDVLKQFKTLTAPKKKNTSKRRRK